MTQRFHMTQMAPLFKKNNIILKEDLSRCPLRVLMPFKVLTVI